jgi:isoquinoline 1-oxidoreductase subunit alpha
MMLVTINEKSCHVDASPDMPLLWVIREYLKLTGTKYGCGISQCGACTVQIDGQAKRSCQVPLSEVEGKKITTIEGIPEDHPVKRAWLEDDVPQCGYCQPGQIMQAISLLETTPEPTDNDIDKAMSGIICRCGTYQRIRRAIHRAASMALKGEKS